MSQKEYDIYEFCIQNKSEIIKLLINIDKNTIFSETCPRYILKDHIAVENAQILKEFLLDLNSFDLETINLIINEKFVNILKEE